MPDKVVVARFDSEAATMQAASALVGSGVPAGAIQRQAGAPAHEPSEQSAGDIWNWLLGEESPVRDKSIWRGRPAPPPSPSLFPRRKRNLPRR